MTTAPTTSTVELRHVRRGTGPDVLLVAGLGDVAEAWQPQLDGLSGRYTVTAYDNRGVGTSPMPADGRLSAGSMADDAVAVMDRLGIDAAHVAGFSGGGVIAMHLALRHPERVRSLVLNGTFAAPDELLARTFRGWQWLAEHAPNDRAFLELFLTWVYTPAFHASGAVDRIVDAMLADPHPQAVEAFQATIDTYLEHDVRDALHRIAVPALVLSGELDLVCPPRFGQAIADAIPAAEHVVLAGHAHQPFQEDPELWNARVDAFWSRVDGAR